MRELEDDLVPAREVRRQLGDVSDMTLWRWTKQKILPPPVRINGRKYWAQADVRRAKQGNAVAA
jgi:predicted DNA-binding transcriptional regulator AlpA